MQTASRLVSGHPIRPFIWSARVSVTRNYERQDIFNDKRNLRVGKVKAELVTQSGRAVQIVTVTLLPKLLCFRPWTQTWSAWEIWLTSRVPTSNVFTRTCDSAEIWSHGVPTARQLFELRRLPSLETKFDSPCRISYPGGTGRHPWSFPQILLVPTEITGTKWSHDHGYQSKYSVAVVGSVVNRSLPLYRTSSASRSMAKD